MAFNASGDSISPGCTFGKSRNTGAYGICDDGDAFVQYLAQDLLFRFEVIVDTAGFDAGSIRNLAQSSCCITMMPE
ncbi:hypothetical protein BSY239_2751 [Hydrogenophaga sp. RAC07]|nr:hypothetical protein BSY239_2751 [Hydrogenophaga sp. RAC07]